MTNNTLLDKLNANIKLNDTVVFTAIVKDYRVAPTKTGKNYVTCTLANVNGTIVGKIWDAIEVSKYTPDAIQHKVVKCVGRVNEYNGVYEINVTNLEILPEGSYDITELERSADGNALANEFMTYFNALPDEWKLIVNHLFSCIDKGWERFCTAYAASGYHDAQRCGLINHTVKMLRILDVVLKNDSRLEELRNLLTVGVMIHDLGKVEEMDSGVYNKDAYINHRMRGITYLTRKEQVIKEAVGADNFNRLMSIVHEHHGGLQAEPMHTVYALLVFMVDNCDAQFTNVADVLSGVTQPISKGENKGIRYDDTFLVI